MFHAYHAVANYVAGLKLIKQLFLCLNRLISGAQLRQSPTQSPTWGAMRLLPWMEFVMSACFIGLYRATVCLYLWPHLPTSHCRLDGFRLYKDGPRPFSTGKIFPATTHWSMYKFHQFDVPRCWGLLRPKRTQLPMSSSIVQNWFSIPKQKNIASSGWKARHEAINKEVCQLESINSVFASTNLVWEPRAFIFARLYASRTAMRLQNHLSHEAVRIQLFGRCTANIAMLGCNRVRAMV